MNAVVDDKLLPAWADSVHAAQATFRCVLNALAEPGLKHTLPVTIAGPAPLDASTTALCLALMDFETPVWCDAVAHTAAVAAYLRFHCGCPLVDDMDRASFAIVADATEIRLDRFAQGSMEFPDQSTTLLIQVPTLTGGPLRTLSGPGIKESRPLQVGGLPADFDARRRENAAAFPLGVDIVFCCGEEIVGLPRTTRLQS
jgi:alpha-D-ribose 1-methylphosphonate 5-triphosphate synthase subunit PhnH